MSLPGIVISAITVGEPISVKPAAGAAASR